MFRLPEHLRKLWRSDFLRHGSIVFASTMVVNVVNYFYHMSCSRILGVVGYGSLATLVAGYSIAGALVNVLNMITVKFAAELHAVDDHARLRGLMQLMLTACTTVAFAIILIYLICARSMVAYLSIGFRPLALTVLAAAGAIVVPAVRGILQGVQDYTAFTISTSVECVTRLLCGFGLVTAGFGVGGAISGFAAGSAVSFVYSLIAVQRHLGSERGISMKLDTRRLAQTTSRVTLSMCALTILGFVDVVLVKHYFNAYDAGLYGVLSLTGKLIMFSVSFIPTVLLPKAVNKVMRGESARVALLQAAGATVALSCCALLIFFAAPGLIVHLLAGNAFVSVAPLIFTYGIAMSLLAATTLAATYNIGVHRFTFVPWILAIAVAEIAAISFAHASLIEVIRIVVGTNACALAATVAPSLLAALRRGNSAGRLERSRT